MVTPPQAWEDLVQVKQCDFQVCVPKWGGQEGQTETLELEQTRLLLRPHVHPLTLHAGTFLDDKSAG